MKKLIIVIVLLMPLSLCAQTGRVNLTGALHPLNWAFPVMLDLRHVGLVATAASVDADSNGLLDKEWLDWPDMILGDFQYQTNWRLFYSDGSGDVTELAFGTSGQYLKSNGITSIPSWDTPSGGSGMPAADFNDSLESQVHFSPKLYEKIDSTTAKIPTAELADSTVAVPDSIDCNAITVNRRVKAQAIDVDTVDVGGDEIVDFAWTGLYVTNHKLAAQLGTSIVSGEIVNQTIVRDDIDSSAGLTLLHLHKYNSNVDDSSYLTKGYIDGQFFTEAQVQAEIGDSNAEYLTRVQFKDSLDAAAYLDSSNLANQGITPDDIDTIDNKFVFSDVYRGTSAQAESVFVTIETIEDTAAAVRVDLIRQYIDLIAPAAKSGTDDVIVTLSHTEAYTFILFIDSSTVASANDTVVVVAGIPIACDIDSLIFAYKVADGVSGLIDSLSIIGPDRSSGTNVADSVYQTLTTDRTSTSIARVAVNLTDIPATAGERFGVVFHTKLDANDYVKVYYVQWFVKE